MKDLEGIGRWPRRLLHVPSMTSLEWEPGNFYGVTQAPKYNILSYTWGRYRLDRDGYQRPPELESIRGIPIQGVEWDVPPIDPIHFTEHGLRTVLEWVAQCRQLWRMQVRGETWLRLLIGWLPSRMQASYLSWVKVVVCWRRETIRSCSGRKASITK